MRDRVTNNAGEIQASIYAIKIAKDLGIEKLCISTDSQFLINAITNWIATWKRKGWRLTNGEPVKNVDDFKELDNLLTDDKISIKWVSNLSSNFKLIIILIRPGHTFSHAVFTLIKVCALTLVSFLDGFYHVNILGKINF